jgi:signal transduction histidine kinase/CheY-like chemotaxis protein
MTHQGHMTDYLPIAYFLFNHRYDVVDCNRAAVDIFAREVSNSFEIARLHLISRARYIYPGYESDKDFTEQVIQGACKQSLEKGHFHYEHTFMTLSGEAIPCEVTIIPVRMEDGQGYIHYLRDLHDNQRIKAEVRRREAAEEESHAKSRFVARMSHEIRTPIHAVLGIAELLLQKEDLPADIYESLTRINASSGLLMSILNDILDLAKVEAGKMEILYAPYDINRLVTNTAQLNRIHENEDLTFSVTVDGNIPRLLLGDEMRIRQILNNLLSNAFKYTQKGTVSLSAAVETGRDGGPILRFIVKDTGQGLTNEQQERLFESDFTRFNVQSNRNVIGSGLGMSVVKQLLTLMNGEIYIDSDPSAGTKITVFIPQLSAVGMEAMVNAESDEPEPINRSPMPYGKVLVVDDVESNLFLAQGIFKSYELSVDTAQNGKEALDKIINGAVYDIIFMDYLMPDMNGIEAARAMRDLGYIHPIIALTANVTDQSEAIFASNGFDGFIGKPININHLDRYLTFLIRDKYAAAAFLDPSTYLAKPVVLVVDDNPADLSMLSSILRPYYRVLSVRSGEIALDIMEKQKVDLVLLDVVMPELSGFDVQRRMKSNNLDIPVIMISASDKPEDQVKGMALGALDFLRKPLVPETVKQRVELHMGASV